jgi:methionyl-tRNA formyltransferase
MSKVRVCFLGTPVFALTCLKKLYQDDHYEIVGIITQPDRPAGRKMILTPSPVKMFALSHHIPVICPESLKKETLLYDEIRKWKAEIAVVVAYGQILSSQFLSLFPLGAVNVHSSLLPRWRGAAPIQRSIEAGDVETGVCLQRVVQRLDAGDILGQRRIALPLEMNSMELHDELARWGADLLHVELMDFERGNLTPEPQDEAQLNHAAKLRNEEGLLDWSQPASAIHNKIRAFVLGPGTYSKFAGKKLKFHRSRIIDLNEMKDRALCEKVQPWEMIWLPQDQKLVVGSGSGPLEILEIQPESKQKMSADVFSRGYLEFGAITKLSP